MPTNKPRYSVVIDDETLKKVDDHWYNNRFKSRSQATVDLIKKGLEALEKEQNNNSAQ